MEKYSHYHDLRSGRGIPNTTSYNQFFRYNTASTPSAAIMSSTPFTSHQNGFPGNMWGSIQQTNSSQPPPGFRNNPDHQARRILESSRRLNNETILVSNNASLVGSEVLNSENSASRADVSSPGHDLFGPFSMQNQDVPEGERLAGTANPVRIQDSSDRDQIHESDWTHSSVGSGSDSEGVNGSRKRTASKTLFPDAPPVINVPSTLYTGNTGANNFRFGQSGFSFVIPNHTANVRASLAHSIHGFPDHNNSNFDFRAHFVPPQPSNVSQVRVSNPTRVGSQPSLIWDPYNMPLGFCPEPQVTQYGGSKSDCIGTGAGGQPAHGQSRLNRSPENNPSHVVKDSHYDRGNQYNQAMTELNNLEDSLRDPDSLAKAVSTSQAPFSYGVSAANGSCGVGFEHTVASTQSVYSAAGRPQPAFGLQSSSYMPPYSMPVTEADHVVGGRKNEQAFKVTSSSNNPVFNFSPNFNCNKTTEQSHGQVGFNSQNGAHVSVASHNIFSTFPSVDTQAGVHVSTGSYNTNTSLAPGNTHPAVTRASAGSNINPAVTRTPASHNINPAVTRTSACGNSNPAVTKQSTSGNTQTSYGKPPGVYDNVTGGPPHRPNTNFGGHESSLYSSSWSDHNRPGNGFPVNRGPGVKSKPGFSVNEINNHVFHPYPYGVPDHLTGERRGRGDDVLPRGRGMFGVGRDRSTHGRSRERERDWQEERNRRADRERVEAEAGGGATSAVPTAPSVGGQSSDILKEEAAKIRSEVMGSVEEAMSKLKLEYEKISHKIQAEVDRKREEKRKSKNHRSRHHKSRSGEDAGHSTSSRSSDETSGDSSDTSSSAGSSSSRSRHRHRDRGSRKSSGKHEITREEKTMLRQAGFSAKDFRDREEQSSILHDHQRLPGIPATNFVINMSTDSVSQFSGEMEDYAEFKGEFMALAGALPEGSRLAVLKQKVKGTKAEHVISRYLGVSKAAFDAAIKALDTKYDQPDELVQILLFQIQDLFDGSCADDDEKFASLVSAIRIRFQRVFELRPAQVIAANGMLPCFVGCMPKKLHDRVSARRYRKPGWYTFANVLKEAEEHVCFRESQRTCPEKKDADGGHRSSYSRHRSYSPYKKKGSSYHRAGVNAVKVSADEDRTGANSKSSGKSKGEKDKARLDIKPRGERDRSSSTGKWERKKPVEAVDRSRSSSKNSGFNSSADSEGYVPRKRGFSRDRSASRGRFTLLYKCNLCHTDEHSTVDCEVDYSKEQMQQLVRERNMCYICGSPGHRSFICPVREMCPDIVYICHSEECGDVPHSKKFCSIVPKPQDN